MKTATEQINHLITLTQHQNQNYRNNVSAQYQRKLVLLLRAIRDIIRTNYDLEDNIAKYQLQKLINAELKSGLEKIKKELDTELNKFMSMNNKLYTDQLTAVFQPVEKYVKIKETKDTDIISGYNKDPMTFDTSGVHTVSSLWSTFTSRLNTIIKQTVNQAYVLEESERDFESNIYGITANTNVSKGQLDAVIGTFVAFGFSKVLETVNKNNMGTITGYQWISVLDNATSDTCLDLSDRVFYYNYPEKSTLPYEIYPPAHHRCRSTTGAITATYQELGINPEDLTQQQRELLGKPDLTPFSYQQFVDNQPVAVQKEILGEVRYSMWKSGEIQLSQFYTRDGRKYSLAELQRRGYSVSEQYLHYIRS